MATSTLTMKRGHWCCQNLATTKGGLGKKFDPERNIWNAGTTINSLTSQHEYRGVHLLKDSKNHYAFL